MLNYATQHGIRPWYVTGGRIVVSPYNSCDLGGLGPPFFLAGNAFRHWDASYILTIALTR